MTHPLIIQGGMGVAISGWPLARSVSMLGQLGVVSGTGIDTVLTRRLQMGDIGGHIRRAFDRFPIPAVAEQIWDRYFVPEGKAEGMPFKSKPVPSLKPVKAFTDLLVVSNFVEVFLAKENHNGLVGLNLLEKIQLPTLGSLYGAMLAGVDYVIMGAGIPRHIPRMLDMLSRGHVAELPIDVSGRAPEGAVAMSRFDPNEYLGGEIKRPNFLAVVSSTLLGQLLSKRAERPVEGFVIESPTAGGHNSPPRGNFEYTERGEPIYGEKDIPDLARFREFGLPFWLAGSYAGRLREAQAEGAAGIQVGTAFAFCEESGLRSDLKQRVLGQVRAGTVDVYTDPVASPTGFPFKVVQIDGTYSDSAVYQDRGRICDLGYLRELFWQENGTIGYRCGSEPVDDYLEKGGAIECTKGRKCLCNGLLATAGFPQARKGVVESPIVTAGDDLRNLGAFLPDGDDRYTAADVVRKLLS